MFELFQIETDGSPLKRRVSSVEHTAVRAITRLLWVSRTGLGISMPSGGRLVEGDRATEQTTAVPGLLCLPGQERSCGLLPGGPRTGTFSASPLFHEELAWPQTSSSPGIGWSLSGSLLPKGFLWYFRAI